MAPLPEYIVELLSLYLQIVGVALILGLWYVVKRSLGQVVLTPWYGGWICLFGALVAISVALREPGHLGWLMVLYYGLEYAFIYLLFAGAQAAPRRIASPALAVCLVLGGAVYAMGVWPTDPVSFAPHMTLLGLGVIAVFARVIVNRRDWLPGPGTKLVLASLALLALDYLHHAPVALAILYLHGVPSPYYLGLTAYYDLFCQAALGFSMIVVSTDYAREQLEKTNRDLRKVQAHLESLARVDGLTGVLNRNAFDTYVAQAPPADGFIAIFDLDQLKVINDTLGHAAGDAAIALAAAALQSIVRECDAVFRFGGDEFVGIFAERTEEAMEEALASAAGVLASVDAAQFGSLGPPTMSWGYAPFSPHVPILYALRSADKALYVHKARKGRRASDQL